ncbi:MAG: HAD family hydrolase [candidate division KSB1 bacterium]|nr:HAD family hydrolase [candidate division KSB1 bacterium]MDZ7319382.1 HAD family hydrolase [candidate division KSB1 bacterium]MDZ7340905.1 HAD family hydrolase [candidate division KSB1 bacterium]
MINIAEYLQQVRFDIKALLFDWGNTVMKVLPGLEGPMAFWPTVAAVDGIQDILPVLKEHYVLALLSNARHSDQSLVRRALARVNLDHYFQAIFTPQELNLHKPAPQFYFNVLRQIGVEPEHAIMIGDDYQNDIIAAKQVGLWTIWYNPDQQQRPSECYPYHDAVISHLHEVVAVIKEKLAAIRPKI